MRPSLVGAADPKDFFARDQNGQIVSSNLPVFPIFSSKSIDGRGWEFVGTGFTIAPFGLIVTARHVLDVFFEKNKQSRFPVGLCALGPNEVCVRRVISACFMLESDLALGQLEATKLRKSDPSVVLTFTKPEVGAPVFTFAYPNTEVRMGRRGAIIDIQPEYYRGQIKDIYPNGRDVSQLPWPSYQFDLHLHGGASGGPVFSPNGSVFAVNCASFAPYTDTSFGCDIGPIIDGVAPLMRIDGEERTNVSFRELIQIGAVKVE